MDVLTHLPYCGNHFTIYVYRIITSYVNDVLIKLEKIKIKVGTKLFFPHRYLIDLVLFIKNTTLSPNELQRHQVTLYG